MAERAIQQRLASPFAAPAHTQRSFPLSLPARERVRLRVGSKRIETGQNRRDFTRSLRRDPFLTFFFCSKEPNLTSPIAVANSGWSSADFRPLTEFVWPTEADN